MTQLPPGADDPKVSVIIVNFNGRHHLERCLPALSATIATAFETIVVDNGSSDGSVEWLAHEHPEVRLLPAGTNLGFGAANQLGVDHARGEYIAFLNNDTVVEPDWLSVLAGTLDRCETIVAACSLLKLLAHPDVINANGGGMTWVGHGFDRNFGQPVEVVLGQPGLSNVEEVFFPTAAAMLIRKRAFVECGGYDPTFFMYHEDVDLGWRLWLLGKRVVLCRESIVRHAFGGTSTAWWGASFSARLGARHNLRSLLKNYSRRNVLRSVYRLSRLWIAERRFQFLIDAWMWNVRVLRSTLHERARIQRSRVVDDQALFASGLIALDTLYPPVRPSLPTPADEFVRSRLPRVPVILPGEDSALGRLGPGWYPPEGTDGGKWRWTSSVARCVLRVAAHSRGVVRIKVRLSDGLSVGEVIAECNGSVVSSPVTGAEWHTVRVSTVADHEGFLSIAIRTPVARGVDGPRPRPRLGCGVSEISFATEEKTAASVDETVSVVIPTYNRWAQLRDTLAALEAQTERPAEVVVVDDGSTDGTWEELGRLIADRSLSYPLRIHRQSNAGPGSARNAGVAMATGDLVLFLGDDTKPEAGCIKAHVTRHREVSMDCAVVGFTDWCRSSIRVTPFLEVVNSEGYQFGYGAMRDGHDVPFTCFYTSNISIQRNLLLREPFNPAFKQAAWEDTELGYRLALAGIRIIYDSRAITHHSHPMTVRSFLKRMSLVGERSATLFELHPALRHNSAILPPNYPVHAVARHERWLRWFVPAIDTLDRLQIRLPARVYRMLLMSSFCRGIERSRSA